MNYTSNHHLPQWVASDRVRMEDFNAAMSSIEAGLDAASALPYAIGSYTGNGARQKIVLPFEPSLVIISGMTESKDAADSGNIRFFAVTRDNENVRTRVQLFIDGFYVYYDGNNGNHSPDLNQSGRLYDYIAFR